MHTADNSHRNTLPDTLRQSQIFSNTLTYSQTLPETHRHLQTLSGTPRYCHTLSLLLQNPLEEEITIESLKKVLMESPEQKRKAEEEKQRRQITEAFMTESFEALFAKIQAR